MSPERRRQIEELYHAALERDPGRRSGFLAEACRDDVELRREVESLLAQDGVPAIGRGSCIGTSSPPIFWSRRTATPSWRISAWPSSRSASTHLRRRER